MTQETRVYPLDQGMTQEEMAVTFAMTSRSPEPFDEIAGKVTADKSAEFHERWVLGYGHSSVAEHAVLHLAVENISRLACDTLEDNRLASYTEKSSRYQVMTRTGFHVPEELRNLPGEREVFVKTCESLFDRYQELLGLCREHLQDNIPANEGEGSGAYRLRLRRMATDACRSVLPAALLTNVGVTVNARNLSHMISKLLSAETAEERALGERLLEEGRRVTPTLLKHAEPNQHLRSAMDPDSWQTARHRRSPAGPVAQLAHHDYDALNMIAAGILYRRTPVSLGGIREQVMEMEQEQVAEVVDWSMRNIGEHDAAIREFELPHITLELMLDYGAYREFRRHRLQSCYPQPMTIQLGYRTPNLIREAGLEGKFDEAIQTAEHGCRMVAEARMSAAPYLVTHAHHRALVVRMNLREAYHVFELRTSKLAHESLREPMLEAMRQAVAAMPEVFRWLRLRDYPEWWPHPTW